jgi:hypothetical protein
VLVLGCAGAAAIALAGLAPAGVLGEPSEHFVTSAGSLSVIAAHWWNLRKVACSHDHGGVASNGPRPAGQWLAS